MTKKPATDEVYYLTDEQWMLVKTLLLRPRPAEAGDQRDEVAA